MDPRIWATNQQLSVAPLIKLSTVSDNSHPRFANDIRINDLNSLTAVLTDELVNPEGKLVIIDSIAQIMNSRNTLDRRISDIMTNLHK